MSVNKFIGIGNCGKDPEIRATQDGKEIATFSLGMSESWKDKNGEKKQHTEWVNVSVFSQGLVGIVKNYVKKGSKLYIEGSIKTDKYQKDGKDVYSTKVVLQGFNSVIQLLGGKSEEKEGGFSGRGLVDETKAKHSQAKGNDYVEESDDEYQF